MFALQKNTLSFEQQNKQPGSDHVNLKHPPPAFTFAVDFLVKFLTACQWQVAQVICSTRLSLAMIFSCCKRMSVNAIENLQKRQYRFCL